MKAKRLVPIAVAIGATAAVVLLSSTPSRSNSAARATAVAQPVAVLVSPVKREAITTTSRLFGVTRAKRRASLSFTVPGRLARRLVGVGDRIKRGQLLARIDGQQMGNNVAAARAVKTRVAARLRQLESDVSRTRRLAKARAVPTRTLEQVDSQAEAMRAQHGASKVQVREARRVLSETKMRAPFDAVVTAVFAEAGEYVMPGRPVLAIASATSLEVRVEAPESLIAELHKGQSVEVDLPLANRRGLSAKIDAISGAASGTRQLFPLLISLSPTAGLRAGMTAEVTVARRKKSALIVPLGAIVDPSGRAPAVFVLEGDVARRRAISVVRMVGERVAIRGSLAAGQQVVIGGHASLVDGDTVKVTPNKGGAR